MNLLVVTPFCSKDWKSAVRLYDWINTLGGIKNNDVVLVHNKNEPRLLVNRVLLMAKRAAKSVTLLEMPNPSKPEWPIPQNEAFGAAAKYIYDHKLGAFLWLETDAAPIRAGWLTDLEKEYEACGKRYMGGVVQFKPAKKVKVLFGTAVYHQSAWELFDKIKSKNVAFDVAMSSDTVPLSHSSKLFQFEDVSKWTDLSRLNRNVSVLHKDKIGLVISTLSNSPKLMVKDYTMSTHDANKYCVPVTVLLPVYNTKPEFLRRSIDSVRNQSYHHWNLVIVDSSTQKSTRNLLHQYETDSRIRIFDCRGRNLPQSLNKGIKESTTELIARIDADDYMMPDRLASQVTMFANNSYMDVLGTDMQSDNEWRTNHPEYLSLDHLLQSRWGVNHPSVMYRRSSLDMVGGYSESIPAAEDFELWLRMLKQGMIIRNLKECLTSYTRHSEQKSMHDHLQNTVDSLIANNSTAKKKLAFVTFALEYGGAERWLFDLIRATSDRIEWHIGVEQKLRDNCRNTLSHYAKTITFKDGLKDIVSQCDATLFWIPRNGLDYYKCNKPYSMVSHTSIGDPWLRFQASESIGASDINAIGVSKCATEALKSIGFPNATTILNGVPHQYLQHQIVSCKVFKELNVLKPTTYGYLGRLSDDKGLLELIELAKILSPQEIMAVAGQVHPPEKNDELTTVFERDSYNKMKCIGWRNDVSEFLNSSDVCVIPSRYDSFCYSAAESFICGTPVCGTDVGEMHEHKDWIIPFDANARHTLVAMRNALQNEQLEDRCATISKKAMSHYSFQTFKDKWTSFLLSL